MALEGRRLFITRLAIGLAQGLALYALYHAQDAKTWPATNGLIFGPLLVTFLYPPIALILALGQIPWRRAICWAATLVALAASLGLYDVWSAWPQDWVFSPTPGLRPHILPSFQFLLFTGAGFFIAHALVIGGHLDHRFRATYETHFDVAWKLAVQLALAGVFVGAFWVLLLLGAGMFNLIKLDFFQRLIRHEWFSIPVTMLAAAAALHLTDIRPALVRGARTLLLTLLSWLLPVIALICAGFLATLPFTGLKSLWGFGHAAALLLAAAAGLIILINAAHQDGNAERLPPRILKYSAAGAAILPFPLVAIATYAIFLRVQQYGWSSDRVVAVAAIVVGWGYATGYLWAAFARDGALRRMEDWNFGVALLILAVLMALFTPLAKPERIAVADQMARFASGKITPQKFDFAYLRQRGGRYGQKALETLAKNQNLLVKNQAVSLLRQQNPFVVVATPEVVAARIHAYPEGTKLPDDFLRSPQVTGSIRTSGNNVGVTFLPVCQFPADSVCDAFMLDMDGDGTFEILVISENSGVGQIYRHIENGRWEITATVSVPHPCPSLIREFKAGRFSVVTENLPWKQIGLAGIRLPVQQVVERPKCPG